METVRTGRGIEQSQDLGVVEGDDGYVVAKNVLLFEDSVQIRLIDFVLASDDLE